MKRLWSFLVGLLILGTPTARAQYTLYYGTNGGVITLTGYGGMPVNVTVSNFVTCIGEDAFSGCESLTSVIIPNSVTAIGSGAFEATSLTNITIPSSVTNIGDGAFFGAGGLTCIAVSAENPDYSSVDGILFNKSQTALIEYPASKSAASYVVPNGVTSIGDQAFSCADLSSIIIPNSVTNMGDSVFAECISLTNISVNPLNPAISSLNGVLFDKNRSTLLAYPGGEIGAGAIPKCVTTIADDAFSGCIGLTAIIIPGSVTNIGTDAFAECPLLTDINVDPQNPAFSSLNGVLFDKNRSTLLACPGGGSGGYAVPDCVKTIGDDAFFGCSGLTNITIPGSVTNIGTDAFVDCPSLTDINVNPLNPAFSSLNGVLFNKNRSTLLAFPGGDSGGYAVPNRVTTIGNAAFYGCSGLTNIAIPRSVTSIGDQAFGATALTSVTIPNSVTNIGDSAFAQCTSLTNATIPRSVTRIGDEAFSGTAMSGMIFPNSVTNIGKLHPKRLHR
jgi:hypothetical protein